MSKKSEQVAKPPSIGARSKPNFFIALAIVIGVNVAVYGRSLDSPFLFDDPSSVTENTSIVSLWPLVGDAEHPAPLSPPKDIPTSGRPLVNLSLALNYHFGGVNPVGYHVANLFVHMLSTLLLMAIVARTLRLNYFEGQFENRADWLALAAALVWAVHPLQTETVVYVTQRTELFVGFFYLATLYGSLRYWAADSPGSRVLWLALSILACLCGMGCKEVMVTAPVVVLLFERTFIAGSFRNALRRSWPLYVGLAAGWILLAAINYTAPRSHSAGFHVGVLATDWWFTQARLLWMYLKLALWPWPLSIHYAMPYLTSFAAAWPWILATTLLVVVIAVLLWQRNPIGFVGAWALLILSPTLIVPIATEVAAERRMYLPLAALATLVIVGGSMLLSRRTAAFAVIVAMLLVLMSTMDIVRLTEFRDPLLLWQDTLLRGPDDPVAHNYLAIQLALKGQGSEAVDHFHEALRLKPDYADVQFNLGIALISAGQLRDAMECFQRTLVLRPDKAAQVYYAIAGALAKAGRFSNAAEFYEQAIKVNPNYAEAYNDLGNALQSLGKTSDAIQRYQSAIALRPNYADAQYNLATALLTAGRASEAIENFEQALSINPDSAAIHNNLASALLKLGRAQQSIEHSRRALQLSPNDVNAHLNLGEALAATAQLEEAVQQFQAAARLQADCIGAYTSLMQVYARLHRSEDAVQCAEKALSLARSSGQTALTAQIESWLNNYRADKTKADASSKSQAAPAGS